MLHIGFNFDMTKDNLLSSPHLYDLSFLINLTGSKLFTSRSIIEHDEEKIINLYNQKLELKNIPFRVTRFYDKYITNTTKYSIGTLETIKPITTQELIQYYIKFINQDLNTLFDYGIVVKTIYER